MSISKHASAYNLHFPLDLYHSVPVAELISRDNVYFEIYVGLDEKMVGELQKHSLDDSDEELKVTSDRERFGIGSYVQWYEKGRVPFALVHSATRELAAISWFGPKALGRKPLKHLSETERLQDERELEVDDWHTVTYRSYKPFRGKGLMKEFVGFTLDEYAARYPGARFWEGVNSDNPASIALAEKLGFHIDKDVSDPDGKWLIMVRNAK